MSALDPFVEVGAHAILGIIDRLAVDLSDRMEVVLTEPTRRRIRFKGIPGARPVRYLDVVVSEANAPSVARSSSTPHEEKHDV